jgi:alkylation response protein AidB-like acyl-CoA dehydrogenase
LQTSIRQRPAPPRAPFERILADIHDLAPDIAARAAEIEAARRIPPDLMETLRSIGVFRMFVPRSHGGFEFDMPRGLEVVTALSRIDGSVGWNAALGSGIPILTSLLPRDVYDGLYKDGPDVFLSGAGQPSGKAEIIDGEWHVSGRWPFATGCQSAEWIFCLCIMMQDGKPLPGAASGMPLVKGCLVPASQVQIEDTWYVAGLRGTGSHHITLTDVVVPEVHFLDLATSEPCLPGPLYQAGQHLVPLAHGAVAIGIAEGALDDIVALAGAGRQQQRAAVPMQQSEIFQYELGRIAADLWAAKAAFTAQVASHWQHALDGTLKTPALMLEGARAAVWVTATCTRVAEGCYALGGGSALYDSSPLQRRMRDMQVAAQHAAVHPRQYVSAGVQLLGTPPQAAKAGG